eukprot:s944_g7.t4
MSRTNRKDQVVPADAELPRHDLLLAADVGYSKSLAWRLGERCRASLASGARILVCESRQMPECRIAFREAINLGRPPELALRLEKQSPYVAQTGTGRRLESVPYDEKATSYGFWTPKIIEFWPQLALLSLVVMGVMPRRLQMQTWLCNMPWHCNIAVETIHQPLRTWSVNMHLWDIMPTATWVPVPCCCGLTPGRSCRGAFYGFEGGQTAGLNALRTEGCGLNEPRCLLERPKNTEGCGLQLDADEHRLRIGAAVVLWGKSTSALRDKSRCAGHAADFLLEMSWRDVDERHILEKRFAQASEMSEIGYSLPGEMKGKGLQHLQRGGALRGKKGIKIRFVRAPAGGMFSYLQAIRSLEMMLDDLLAEAARRPLPTEGCFRWYGEMNRPGWQGPSPAVLSPSRHSNRPRPAKGGWAGWVCPECSFMNEKGTDFCQNCERDEIEALNANVESRSSSESSDRPPGRRLSVTSGLEALQMTRARELLPGFVLLPKVLSAELQQKLLDTACRVAAAPAPGQSGGWYRCSASTAQLNDGNKARFWDQIDKFPEDFRRLGEQLALAAGEASPILKQPAMDFEPRVGALNFYTGKGRMNWHKDDYNFSDDVFLRATLWALDLIPESCDVKGSGCDWLSLPSAWRYVWNNLRLAVVGAQRHRPATAMWQTAEEEFEDLESRLGQIHRLMETGWHDMARWRADEKTSRSKDRLGEDPGLWYSNWHHASAMARELPRHFARSKPRGIPPVLDRQPAGHGLRVSGGRALQVSRTSRILMRQVEMLGSSCTVAFPLLGVVLRPPDAYQTAWTALNFGFRSFLLPDMNSSTSSTLQDALLAIVSSEVSRGEVRLLGEDEELWADLGELDAISMSSVETKAWQSLVKMRHQGRLKVAGVSGMHPDRVKEFLDEVEEKPAFVISEFTIYEPGGPDEARKLERNRSCGYLEPLVDPHVLDVAQAQSVNGHSVSSAQVIDRWWLQLGGLLFVEASEMQEHLGAFEFSLEDSAMRLLNGLSSLVASSPGRRAPYWCEDAKKDRPIVMASVGDTAEFGYKMQAHEPDASVHLESGDVIIFGGPARDLIHALLQVYPGTAPEALHWDPHLNAAGHRVSITWRDVGVEDGLTFNSDERLGLTVTENTLPRYLPHRSKGGKSRGKGYRWEFNSCS